MLCSSSGATWPSRPIALIGRTPCRTSVRRSITSRSSRVWRAPLRRVRWISRSSAATPSAPAATADQRHPPGRGERDARIDDEGDRLGDHGGAVQERLRGALRLGREGVGEGAHRLAREVRPARGEQGADQAQPQVGRHLRHRVAHLAPREEREHALHGDRRHDEPEQHPERGVEAEGGDRVEDAALEPARRGRRGARRGARVRRQAEEGEERGGAEALRRGGEHEAQEGEQAAPGSRARELEEHPHGVFAVHLRGRRSAIG